MSVSVDKAFSYLDQDGDGVLNAKELKKVMRSLGLEPTEGELLDIISQFDTKGIGAISLSDFSTMMAPKYCKWREEEIIKEAYRLLDNECRGFISTARLRIVLFALGESSTEEEVREIHRELDFDGDGMISYEDFTKVMKEG